MEEQDGHVHVKDILSHEHLQTKSQVVFFYLSAHSLSGSVQPLTPESHETFYPLHCLPTRSYLMFVNGPN